MLQKGVCQSSVCSSGKGQQVLPTAARTLTAKQPHHVFQRQVSVQSTKAVDIHNYDDLATGWKVKRGIEKKAANAINVKDLMEECKTWQQLSALFEENPERFQRNKTLSFSLVLQMAGYIGGPPGVAVSSLSRHIHCPDPSTTSATRKKDENAPAAGLPDQRSEERGPGMDPFAVVMAAMDGNEEGQNSLKGRERLMALAALDNILENMAGNMEKMRADFVCSLLLLLCRLQHKNDKFVKLALVFLKTNTKRFKVAELYSALAACTAMDVKIPASILMAIMDQAQKGFRFVTAQDLNNMAYAMHVYPRGALNSGQGGAIMKRARVVMFDMSGDGLVYLAGVVARQGWRTPPGFTMALAEALKPHMASLNDPHTIATMLYAFAALKFDVHEPMTKATERVLANKRAMATLSTSDLGVLGNALSRALDYTPSEALRTAYVDAVEAKLSDADETTAGALISGLAYMQRHAAADSKPAAAAKPSAVAARLAKLAAKKAPGTAKPAAATAAAPAAPLVKQELITELLDISEGGLMKMGAASLRSLSTSLRELNVVPGPSFSDAYQTAVAVGVERCQTYSALTALALAATGSGLQALALPPPSEVEDPTAADLNDEASGFITTVSFAEDIAAQAVLISQGPKQVEQPQPAAAEAGDDIVDDLAEMPPPEDAAVTRKRFLPTDLELKALTDALSQLDEVDVSQLVLPEAKPFTGMQEAMELGDSEPKPRARRPADSAAGGYKFRNRDMDSFDFDYRRDDARQQRDDWFDDGDGDLDASPWQSNDGRRNRDAGRRWQEQTSGLNKDDFYGDDGYGNSGGYMQPSTRGNNSRRGSGIGFDMGDDDFGGDFQDNANFNSWSGEGYSTARGGSRQRNTSQSYNSQQQRGDSGWFNDPEDGAFNELGVDNDDLGFDDPPQSRSRPAASTSGRGQSSSSPYQSKPGPQRKGMGLSVDMDDMFDDDMDTFGTVGQPGPASSGSRAKGSNFSGLMDDFDFMGDDDNSSIGSPGAPYSKQAPASGNSQQDMYGDFDDDMMFDDFSAPAGKGQGKGGLDVGMEFDDFDFDDTPPQKSARR